MLLLLTNNAAGLHVQVVQTEGIGAHADHCSEKGACAEDWTPASDCSGSVVVQTQVPLDIPHSKKNAQQKFRIAGQQRIFSIGGK